MLTLMARSFFTGTDHQLYMGSKAFSAKISESAESYGLQPEQAAQYALLNEAYAQAYQTSREPAHRTPGATASKNDAKSALKLMAAQLAKIIDGTASVSAAQKIELGLNVRAMPSPMAPPGKPDQFGVILLGDGSIRIKWKCPNPVGAHGTVYQVWRRNAPGAAYTFLGSTGHKRFDDATLPAGSSCVTYKVQAVRSKSTGPATEYVVMFGVTAAMSAMANSVQGMRAA
jgi:hypothetical protein